MSLGSTSTYDLLHRSRTIGRSALAAALVAILAALAAVSTAAAAIRLEPVLAGLDDPLYVTSARDGSNRLFIVERAGIIKVLQPGASTPTIFLDISERVRTSGSEQGLLGLAFHPQYASNGRFFVHYSPEGPNATVVAEYRVSAGNPNVADTAETVILAMPQPFTNHNGGMVEFGPDGFLYIAKGDGGSANDPGNRAQNVDELLGKILRIDVDHPSGGNAYSSPSGNPFLGATPGRDEIYALGLRNPWRFSFDRLTGALHVGDVGQGAREEINIVTAGGNYGWRVWEGTHCTGNGPAPCTNSGYVFPIAEYEHSGGRCSVTGGYVYRGTRGSLPAGAYVYADYCSGEMFQWLDGDATDLLDTGHNIASFGEDEAGEIYVVALGGTVYRIASDTTCAYTLSSTSRSVPVQGIQGLGVHVGAPDGCDWTAVSNDAWITITSGQSGSGDGEVVLSVAPNAQSESTRVGTVSIAGRTFTITEAGCSYALSPTSRSVLVGGIQSAGASVNTHTVCPWTAVSNASWITVTSGASRTGTGQTVFAVAPNHQSTSARVGTLTIASRTFTVTQAGCTYTLSPTSRAVPVGGVPSAAASVSTSSGCSWTAESHDPWIVVTSGAARTGSGQLVFRVASNHETTASRVGTLTIAGSTFTVTQAGCSYSLTPTSRAVPAGGQAGLTLNVVAPAGCSWTATENDAWLAITAGRSGAGNGRVDFRVAANQGSTSTRTGTLTIAGRIFTVVQPGCTFSLSATSRSIAAGGVQSSAVAVTAPAGCAWTAASNDTWITVASGSSGTGGGQVVFRVAPNPGPARTGTLTIAGRTFTVSQAGAP
jgi:glucose/arabinose dehydrogenase